MTIWNAYWPPELINLVIQQMFIDHLFFPGIILGTEDSSMKNKINKTKKDK